MKVYKILITFKTHSWLTLEADSGTWVLGDSPEDVRVDLAIRGMMGLSKKMVAIGHVGEVPEGSETTAVLLLETDSDVATFIGATGGHFSLSSEGGRVEFDRNDSPSGSGAITLRLTKLSPTSGEAP